MNQTHISAPAPAAVIRSARSSRIAVLCENRTRTARLYNRIHARMSRGDGYQPFGYDLVTLRLTRPAWAALICDVAAAHNSLPRVSA
jgi:hypothetical protein